MEFALVVPMLVLLVVGIAEFGRAYQVQTTLSGAAREGVRVMALQNAPEAARTTVQNYAPELEIQPSQIEVSPSSCSAGGTATVRVTYRFTFVTGHLGPDLTLTGKGRMRCNG